MPFIPESGDIISSPSGNPLCLNSERLKLRKAIKKEEMQLHLKMMVAMGFEEALGNLQEKMGADSLAKTDLTSKTYSHLLPHNCSDPDLTSERILEAEMTVMTKHHQAGE